MSALLDICKDAVALAKKKGCSDAIASTHRTREVDLTWRDGRVEKTSEATTRSLSMALYVDGRYSAVSTSDLRPEAVSAFLDDAIAMARTLSPDPFRALPDPKLYAGRSTADLQLADPKYAGVGPEARLRVVKELEDAARAVKGAAEIISVTTSTGDTQAERARFSSNGFEGEIRSTSFWTSADVTVKDPDGRKPEDWWSASARHLGDLPSPGEVGRIAAERALGAIGSKKAESAVLPLVIENRAAGKLWGALIGPLSGRSLQQKQSFLEGKLGTEIGNKLVTVIDDPLIPRGLASRLWDADGIAARRMPVIEHGVLKAYFVDDYYGRKLKMAPTTASSSNLVFAPGKRDLAGLLADVKEGVLVTAFLGGNSNGTTGDYSFGIQGYRIRGGKRAEPVSETNIAGNQKELWKKLVALGSDAWPYGSVRTPSLVFEGVTIAGA
jgi:PmbA protein